MVFSKKAHSSSSIEARIAEGLEEHPSGNIDQELARAFSVAASLNAANTAPSCVGTRVCSGGACCI
ncbi:hypothetical protein [Pendulispora albinea]|uniref:Uncharacterized protein n=1 Tax=Pendulispora albinea TaxID=2741071 RepID=A0ABZ2LPX0_9BACT